MDGPRRRLFRELAVLALVMMAPVGAAQTPLEGENHFNLGLAHLREGRTELALEEFKRAVKRDPRNASYHKGLGVAYSQLADMCAAKDEPCRQSRRKEAVAAARRALELDPYYVDVRNDLGTALIRWGKREEGKKELLAAFNDPLNPTPEVSGRNLGEAYFEENNYAEALNWFRSSANRNKSYPDAYRGVADCLVALGRVEEAVSELEIAVKEIPEDPALLLALGEAYYRAGRFVDARPKLEQAARKDPVGRSGRRAADLLKHFPK